MTLPILRIVRVGSVFFIAIFYTSQKKQNDAQN